MSLPVNDKKGAFRFAWRAFAPRGAPVPVEEYHFCHGRKFRFDFAFGAKVAVEIDGNAWKVKGGGRHSQDSDREKMNLAAAAGWRVFRFSPGQVERDPSGCVALVLKGLGL
jgi:hypothetical protein